MWGIRVTGPKAASAQPFVGIVDCGASFSAVNWAAARLLGLLDASGDLKGPRGPDVISLGESTPAGTVALGGGGVHLAERCTSLAGLVVANLCGSCTVLWAHGYWEVVTLLLGCGCGRVCLQVLTAGRCRTRPQT